MSGTEHSSSVASAPVPLLFIIADTGGGHRSAARAVGQALDQAYPGRFGPVLCDPLSGPGSARLLRWVTGLYGPAIRLAPWLWGAAYHACNSRPAMRLRQLVAEIGRLRDDRAAVDAMRAASACLGRPGAAADIAELIVGLVKAGAGVPRPLRQGGWDCAAVVTAAQSHPRY
jgi:hypothetical protein